ncbi:MAG: hypothetical protein QM396_01475 [Euryarchaeota archaeon]|uniref:hypothetical protein n=1 Tax=Methanobacterium sp. MZD130B TaxID=3394378 RepID=UPI001753BD94|nr:hypothetical protein [Euryarchaeota archaeon]HHT18398.1 hypothetical protein [Methanobacterium sp.]
MDVNYYLTHPDNLKKLYLKFIPTLLVFEYESVNIITTDDEVRKLKSELKKRDKRDLTRDEELRQMRKDLDRSLQIKKMEEPLTKIRKINNN